MPKQKPVLNKMRHPEYARDEEWIVRFLKEAKVGRIATRTGNQPYITPTLFWYSPDQYKKKFLYGLIDKYFPGMQPGEHYRPITGKELKHTSVYAIAIEKWSGKYHWPEQADQGDEWPPLDEEWFR
jgi:nitroimidazol reductase NimA-like FMN-containing flavoprotein (pyridoxamine 5'-phosphate oxidase superfamily)